VRFPFRVEQQMVTGVTYALKRLDNNGNAYPFTSQARDQAEFTTADFDTAWNKLIANSDSQQ
jgi:hypothetical protein